MTFVQGSSYDYEHMNDLFVEIEIRLGEEQEMDAITSPASVDIPTELVHCPLIIKRVDKHWFFFTSGGDYEYLHISGGGTIPGSYGTMGTGKLGYDTDWLVYPGYYRYT